jgi:hypothetical protein
MGGMVRVHELEPFDGIEPVSRANQAAAFQDLALLTGRGILATHHQLRPFLGRQAIAALSRVAIRLPHPSPNALRRGLELASE